MTPTPSPAASPDVTPVASWIGPGGKELWLEVRAVNNVTIQNIATYATNCTSEQLSLARVMTNGATKLFRFDASRVVGNPMVCASGAHGWVVEWQDGDGNCQGCLTDTKTFSFPAAPTFPAGPGILQNLGAYIAYTTTSIRFTATNAAGPAVTVGGWRLYDAGGLAQPDCTFPATSIGPSTEPALFDTCKQDTTGAYPNLTPAGSYTVYLYGNLDDGSEYYEYGPLPVTQQ